MNINFIVKDNNYSDYHDYNIHVQLNSPIEI